MNRTWTEAKLEAQNRIRWRKNIKALWSTGSEEDWLTDWNRSKTHQK
jgi:hypothetical protein